MSDARKAKVYESLIDKIDLIFSRNIDISGLNAASLNLETMVTKARWPL